VITAVIAYAKGSPSQTIVVDSSNLMLYDLDKIKSILRFLHYTFNESNCGNSLISKFAFVRPAAENSLEYLFAQLVPGNTPFFDFTGSCAHSILAAVTSAFHWNWFGTHLPVPTIRILVENNGDQLECEIESIDSDAYFYSLSFLFQPSIALPSLLMAGGPTTLLETPLGKWKVSFVNAGNPYIFVDAKHLGISSEQGLFTANQDFYKQLQIIREAGSDLLGWDKTSVFPKIAALGAFVTGRLSARAISVPTWHPSLALTGAICTCMAASIEGTIVSQIAQNSSSLTSDLNISTPSEQLIVRCQKFISTQGERLQRISISHQQAKIVKSLLLNDSLV
jgi:2-methylaconitate cis-trans-isomerase PrpF